MLNPYKKPILISIISMMTRNTYKNSPSNDVALRASLSEQCV